MNSTTVLRIGLIFSLCFVTIRAGSKPIPNELLDFTVTDTLLKYRYVLIAFLRIVDSKKTSSDELKGNSLCAPSESTIINAKSIPKLVQTASAILARYEKVVSKTTDYATVAYNYRLLEWLKFSMRERDVKNQILEGDIARIEITLKSNAQQIFIVLFSVSDNEFQKTVSFVYGIEQRCKEIENLAQLQKFGAEQDQIVGFLLILGSGGETAAEDQRIKMPFPDKPTAYEDLIHEAALTSDEFKLFFKGDTLTILDYLYQAMSVRLRFSSQYESTDIQNIRLPDTPTDKMKYTCEVMTLFNRAIEQILEELNEARLSKKYNLETVFNRKKIRRIENFYVDARQIDQLRTDPIDSKTYPARSYKRGCDYHILLKLIREVVSIYDKFIEKVEGELPQTIRVAISPLPDAFVVMYGRIVEWLDKQMKKIDQYYENSELSKLLAGILQSRRAGIELKKPNTNIHDLPDSLNYDPDLPEKEYLKTATMAELNSLYRYGPKQT